MRGYAWHEDAACRGKLELFTIPEWFLRHRSKGGHRSYERLAAAKAICATCPVFDSCDAHYRENPDYFMVTAGRLPWEQPPRRAGRGRKYDLAQVAAVARGATDTGIARAVSQYFQVSEAMATYLIRQAREHGHWIPAWRGPKVWAANRRRAKDGAA